MKKTNIFFIQPLFYNPMLPNFKDRFELLSERCCGHVVSSSDRNFNGLKLGEFTYHSLPFIKNRFYKYAYYVTRSVLIGLKANRKRRIDVVHSYDPYFNGLAAVIISRLTGARLIVEVNGEHGWLHTRPGQRIKRVLKNTILLSLTRLSFRRSCAVKFLNSEHMNGWKSLLGGKKSVVFHDFIPTHVFDPRISKDGGYILCMGHPFYRKGVDVLIKAFLKISDRYPDMRLKIVGHCPDREEKARYVEMAGDNDRVEILNPVFYEDAVRLLQDCTFFVLPSRSEAMGRVLIEAMACGKAVIGSKVGGIPEVIEDGSNGLLFNSGDTNELAEKMKTLLSNRVLMSEMGRRGVETVEERFSSKIYVERFCEAVSAAGR